MLLGGFVVAQCRHDPDLHVIFASNIKDFLPQHRRPDVAEKNLAALAVLLADPNAARISDPDIEVPLEEARARNHR